MTNWQWAIIIKLQKPNKCSAGGNDYDFYYFFNYTSTKYQYFTIITTINREFWLRGMTLAIVLISYCLTILFFRIIRAKSDSDLVQELTEGANRDAWIAFAQSWVELYECGCNNKNRGADM